MGLRTYLSEHPTDPHAWLLLGGLAPEPRIRAAALRRALALDPANVAAQRGLAALEPLLEDSSASPATVAEMPLPLPEPSEEPEESAPAVRQARALIWPFRPRGDPEKPLGTLLDEGKVTRQDLEWAAKQAREPEIREAAQVLLAFDHRLPDATMTVEQARLTAWPFRRLNQPLGQLIEAGTVKEKDLRRAAWFATDARVREAARLMVPYAIERQRARPRRPRPTQPPAPPAASGPPQPPPLRAEAPRGAHYVQGGARYQPSPARPMPIVEGADYLIRQLRRRQVQRGVLLTVALVLVVGGLGGLLYMLLTGTPHLWLVGVVLLLAAALLWMWDYLSEIMQEIQYFEQGQQGEIQAARLLRQGLNGLWILFRNVRLPGQHDDIDLVLLGPPGIFAVEVKAYSGHFAYRGQTWQRRVVMGWRRLRRNPGKQARANAGQLHEYIRKTLGWDIWVEPRVLWAGSGKLDLQQPEVYVWLLERLSGETERLRNLPGRVATDEWAALTGLLKGLCSTLQE